MRPLRSNGGIWQQSAEYIRLNKKILAKSNEGRKIATIELIPDLLNGGYLMFIIQWIVISNSVFSLGLQHRFFWWPNVVYRILYKDLFLFPARLTLRHFVPDCDGMSIDTHQENLLMKNTYPSGCHPRFWNFLYNFKYPMTGSCLNMKACFW